jgi:hypothetical protein
VRDWIAALDAATGKVLWRKFTIPATSGSWHIESFAAAHNIPLDL